MSNTAARRQISLAESFSLSAAFPRLSPICLCCTAGPSCGSRSSSSTRLSLILIPSPALLRLSGPLLEAPDRLCVWRPATRRSPTLSRSRERDAAPRCRPARRVAIGNETLRDRNKEPPSASTQYQLDPKDTL